MDNSLIEFHYNELMHDGVTVVKSSYTNEFINDTLSGIKKFINKNSNIFDQHRNIQGFLPRVVNLHVAYPEIMKLFTHAKLALAVQDKFFNDKSCVYTSLYFEVGTQQPLHRDTPYFCTKPEYQYLGVWVALEDAVEENGCLQVIKGAHLLPELDRDKIGIDLFGSLEKVPAHSQALWDTYQKQVISKAIEKGLKVSRIPVKKGDIVIWHPQLPHGGSEIVNNHLSRYSIVFHVTPVDIPVYHMDVFFNSQKKFSMKAPWQYKKFEDRSYSEQKNIDINHSNVYALSQFK